MIKTHIQFGSIHQSFPHYTLARLSINTISHHANPYKRCHYYFLCVVFLLYLYWSHSNWQYNEIFSHIFIVWYSFGHFNATNHIQINYSMNDTWIIEHGWLTKAHGLFVFYFFIFCIIFNLINFWRQPFICYIGNFCLLFNIPLPTFDQNI